MPLSTPHIVVDTQTMLAERLSGIGHYGLGIAQAMDRLAAGGLFSYSLIAPRKLYGRVPALPLRACRDAVPVGRLAEKLTHQILKRRLGLSIDWLLPEGAYYFPAFKVLPMKARPTSVVIHDLAHLDVPECVEAGNVAFLDYALPRSVAQARSLIAVSEFTRQRIVHHFQVDPARIHVAPPAVDRRVYRPVDPVQARATRERYGVDCEAYFLSVATLEPRKNLLNLIDAFAALPPAERRHYALVLIGAKGWDNGATQARIEQARKAGARIVQPSGFVADEDMAAFYTGAQALAFVPLYEGFGMPPLEAYACGTPVLASRVASVPEAAGEPARYVDDPRDVAAIRDGLLALAALGQAGRQSLQPAMQRHLERFDWMHSGAATVSAITGIPASALLGSVDYPPPAAA
ncbi:Mannosylfructose-phosphate synthase [Pigmentiphaga humi]|uniref:Mannosylfructose-phosphate synthase n=1 Tax=Pigmentiphaga humi TaxID=2478468 RepID=A0A3P4B859_9BURK|nr:glycosyltransferase family 1 protein [Pigmentiphaga humi]VCU72507.1 Mannosylfructose-phosphate synthase [Pigmentiphaga humi]